MAHAGQSLPERLPVELHEPVIEELADDPHTLALCALVSKRWLHYSRARYFSTRTVWISRYGDQPLIDLLTEEDGKCTFHSYIVSAGIIGYYPTPEESYIECGFLNYLDFLFSHTITRFPNLTSVHLVKFCWSLLSPSSMKAFSSLKSLTRINFIAGDFFGPREMVDILERHEGKITQCHLTNTFIHDKNSNNSDPDLPLQSPSALEEIEFHIRIPRSWPIQYMADLLLTYLPNIRKLEIMKPMHDPDDYILQRRLIYHSGSSLVGLRFSIAEFSTLNSEFYRNNEVSLATNVALEELNIGKMPFSLMSDEQFADISWLSSLLRSLPRENHFKKLSMGFRGRLAGFTEIGVREARLLEKFAWESLETMLMDCHHFTDQVPVIEMVFDEWDRGLVPAVMDKLARRMPRMEAEGKLGYVIEEADQ